VSRRRNLLGWGGVGWGLVKVGFWPLWVCRLALFDQFWHVHKKACWDESFQAVQLLLVSILNFFLWFQARTQILNRSGTENLKPCCFLSYCCSSSYCRKENLVEASTAPLKWYETATWASTYASSFLEIAGAVKVVSSVLFQGSRVIPVWVLIIPGVIPVLLLVLLLLHGTWASSIFHQKNTNVWIWLEYTFWHWSFV